MLLLAALLVSWSPGGAAAADREYRESFNWGDPTVGFAGWMFDEFDGGGSVVPQKFYRGQTEDGPLGRGLTITPTGADGQPYPSDISGRFTYYVPGRPGAVVDLRQVMFQRVTARVRERQFLRYELRDQMGAFVTRQLGDGSADVDGGDVTLTDTNAGRVGRSGLMWMFTPTCTNCTSVDPAQGSINHVRGAELALIDHEAPTITASGPLWDARGRWVRATPDGVALRSRDPGSGVRSFTFQRAGGRSLTRSGDCRLKYDDPTRGSQVCANAPSDAQITAGSIGALPSGQNTFIATARDRAGQQGDRLRWTVKVDRTPPRIAATPELQAVDGKFAKLSDTFRARVVAVDPQSGIRSVRARIEPPEGAVRTRGVFDCAEAAIQCPRIARGAFSFAIEDLPKGTSRVSLVVTDLAGNTTTSRERRIKVDRSKPFTPNLRPEPSARRAAKVVWTPVGDREGGSGVAGYEYAIVDRSRALSFDTVAATFTPTQGRTSQPIPRQVANGQKAVLVRAVDRAGNKGVADVYFGGIAPTLGRPVAAPAVAAAAVVTFKLFCKLSSAVNKTGLGRRAAERTLSAIPGIGPVTADVYELASTLCNVESKVESKIVDLLAKPVGKVCKSAGNVCRKVINTFCSVVSKKVCAAMKTAACFATDLRIFCTKKQKADGERKKVDLKKRADAKRDVDVAKKRTRFGRHGCGPGATGASRRAKELAAKAGDLATEVVYWAPPPLNLRTDQAVVYVGRSIDIADRCRRYKNPRRDSRRESEERFDKRKEREQRRFELLQTLALPRLTTFEAKNVEEALIAHFGVIDEAPNAGVRPALVAIQNDRHELPPESAGYCDRLLFGQYMLAAHGYKYYAGARYTRNVRCPGIG